MYTDSRWRGKVLIAARIDLHIAVRIHAWQRVHADMLCSGNTDGQVLMLLLYLECVTATVSS